MTVLNDPLAVHICYHLRQPYGMIGWVVRFGQVDAEPHPSPNSLAGKGPG